MHISSSYAKILGETNFQPRKIPQSGSKAKDRKERKREKENTPGTAGGPGGRDRMLAIKSRKTAEKNTFFSLKKKKIPPKNIFFCAYIF